MIDTYLTLATIEQEKMKNVVCCFFCSFFWFLRSTISSLSLEYRALRDMKSLCLLYYFIVGKCFWYLGR